MIIPSPVHRTSAGFTPALDNRVQWRMPPGGAAGTTPPAAAASDEAPVDVASRAAAGVRQGSFFDDWYNRIHLAPTALDVGNLVSAQTHQIEVWNAYRTSQQLAAIAAQGNDGLTLTGPAAPPTTYAPLEARTYTLSVDQDGPPVIDASWTFDFPSDDPVLVVIGRRVVVLAFRPNWRAGWRERLEWLTDVLEAWDGTEQRISLREYPRRRFEYEILARGQAATWLDALLVAWQARIYATPVWPDARLLTADVLAGTTTLSVDTTDTDFHPAGLALLVKDYQTHESVEIASMTAGSITLKRPLENTWPAGTKVVPARLARVGEVQTMRRIVDDAVVTRLALAVDEDTVPAETAADSGTVYQGVPVLERPPNWSEPLEQGMVRAIVALDYRTGRVAVDDRTGQPLTMRKFEWLLGDRTDLGVFRAWLLARAGRLNATWVPSWSADLELAQDVSAGATSLVVRDINYRNYYQFARGRQDIAIELNDGTVFYRRIVAAAAGSPGEEVLSIDASLGQAVGVADVRRIMWMSLMRLESDAAELLYESDSIARCVLTLRGVVQ